MGSGLTILIQRTSFVQMIIMLVLIIGLYSCFVGIQKGFDMLKQHISKKKKEKKMA